MWVVDPSIQSLLGTLGTFAAIYLFLSPLNTFKRILANKSTEQFSPFPYFSTFVNCSLWVVYATPFITPDRFSPFITNAIGFVFQSVYIAIFLKHAKGDTKRDATRGFIGCILLVCSIIVLLSLLPPLSRSSTVGTFAVFFTIVMFGSPLSALGLVLKTQSVEFMPFNLSLGTFVCSTMWLLYGLYVLDYFVLFPNLIGSILGIIQLVVYAVVDSKSKRQKLEEKQTSEVEKKAFIDGNERL